MAGAVYTQQEMAVIRRTYARQMLAVAGVTDNPRLEDALAGVARERFLGDPPWRIVSRFKGYELLPTDDPAVVYQDVLFALAVQHGVNNGSPSLHTGWLHALNVREGERVAHIGAGTGYYTALLSHLVGERGHVTAVEYDPELAALARICLADRTNVTVVEGDGAEWPREDVDAVYVNFAAERPAEPWIDSLRPGGRLIVPLGTPRPKPSPTGGTFSLYGAGFRFTRHEAGLQAQWLNPVSFVCAEGRLATPGPEREVLKASFERGGIEFVRSLVWRKTAPPGRCWFTGQGWALSYDEVSR